MMYLRTLFLGHNSWTKNSNFVKNSFPSKCMYNVSLQKNQKFLVQIVLYGT
jgi:hypothetical protein